MFERAALLLVFVALPRLLPAADCGDVCVDVVESGRDVAFYLVNPYPYPITATVHARTRNLRSDGGNTVTVTLGGGDRKRALHFQRSEPGGHYDYRYWYDWTFGRRDAVHDDSVLYRLPYAAGSRFRVIQGFQSRFSHDGRESFAVDFRMPVGTPVHAARGGVVVDVEESHDQGGWDDRYYKTANYVVVLHGDGTTGEYYHLKHRGSAVSVGERIRAGDLVGWSGNTGHTTTPHLHFAVYRADTWGRTQSVPFRFVTSEGIIDRPRPWARYGVSVTHDGTDG